MVRRRFLIYLSFFLLCVIASVIYIVLTTNQSPKIIFAPLKYDCPNFPQIYNIREVSMIMRKQRIVDQFCYLSPPLRFSDSKKQKCFKYLLDLGVLDVLQKEPDQVQFSGEDFIYGIQTLIALAILAKPYIKHEISCGNWREAQKIVIVLVTLALNYPNGTGGNLPILKKYCSNLLGLLDENVFHAYLQKDADW